MPRIGILQAALLVAAALAAGVPRPGIAAETARASVHTSGSQAEFGNSLAPRVSSTGRFVVFESSAWYLADEPDNSQQHIYLRDRETPLTERISISTAGVLGNNGSLHGSVSADGRFVVFQSQATNLVAPATTFGRFHVFLRDRQEGTTILVSRTPGGVEGNWHSRSPVISADGRYVAFRSGATNLSDPPVGTYEQILRWDRLTGETILVSLTSAGGLPGALCEHASISDDGSRVAFQSYASLEPRDQTGNRDIYLRDIAAGTTELVSVSWDGTAAGSLHSANPALSGDGSHVAFESLADNLIDGIGGGFEQIYVRDIAGEFTTLASINEAGDQANAYSIYPAINGDGSAVSFESAATNLVADLNGWADVFVHRGGMPGHIERVSVRDESLIDPGDPDDGNGWSWVSAIDGSGLITVFESWSTDLVADDTNGFGDIFVRESDPLAADPLLPDALALSGWPNPLRGEGGVELRFALPRAAAIRAEVFDASGRSVRLLATGQRPAGEGGLHWDGCDAAGRRAPAGVYLVRLQTEAETAHRKLVLLP